MPVPSGGARTRFTHLGLFSQRYGSFAGKAVAAEVPGDEITTENAYFARTRTSTNATFRRAVTTADAER